MAPPEPEDADPVLAGYSIQAFYCVRFCPLNFFKLLNGYFRLR